VREIGVEQALAHCRDAIARGSRSFALASLLFPRRLRDAAAFVYGWCRYCDDEIDSHAREESALLANRVSRLRAMTLAALSGELRAGVPEFVGFGHVCGLYRIPAHYPLELVEGMAMDARSERYETLRELERYCYRVASTVGLMMTHAMGLQDVSALGRASDLGKAMQLTNIARDVIEDASLGRVYLPLAWLRERGVSPDAVSDRREDVAAVVVRLLDRAEELYESGREGIRSLPLSAAFAVAVAARVYREIGVRVRMLGPRAWDERVVVSGGRKVALVLGAALEVSRTLPVRLLARRPLVPITEVWRHS
jgi:phytoene synthase